MQELIDDGLRAGELALGDDEEGRGVGEALEIGDEGLLVFGEDGGRDVLLEGVEAGVAALAFAAREAGVDEDGDEAAVADHAASLEVRGIDLQADRDEEARDLLPDGLGV
ncbi:MAG: hypothetical protein R3F14_40420 [Polyangiaceae bacterium]